MNVRQLIELLEDAVLEYGDDAEVQLATQPSWPLRYHLAGVYIPNGDEPPEGHEEHTGDWPGCAECDAPTVADPVVWLVEGSQHYEDPYGVPQQAWEEAIRP